MTNVIYPLGRGEDMSEGEHALLDADPYDPLGAQDYPTLDAPEGEWETKDGTVLPLRRMTDAHLLNALRWMKARGLDRHPKHAELEKERRWRHLR